MEPMVIYEDDDVLVINKPSGLIVHSDGRTDEPALTDWVMERYPYMDAVGEPWTSPQGNVIPRPGIVHRLDRTTSGVMILAKTSGAHTHLKSQFQNRTITKEYRAYVYGHPREDGGVIDWEIRRTKTMPPRWTAEPGGSKRRAAITEWRVLNRGFDADSKAPVTYLSVSPKTGRTHQIRVHLKVLHHPVVCDQLYAPNMPKVLGFERPALHAHRLELVLPSGEARAFDAPFPLDFEKAGTQFEIIA